MGENGVVDRGLQQDSKHLASHGKVVPGLDARLILIDADAGIDKFHVLQGLQDPTQGDGPERYFCFQRWGDTGGRGSSKLDGPTVLPKVEAMFAHVFQEKTGQAWGSVKPGQTTANGKYWPLQNVKPNSLARWEYFVDDRREGEPSWMRRWRPHGVTCMVELEELYAQHLADNCSKRTATRCVQTPVYSYKVDLTKMRQENKTRDIVRQIRRVFYDTGAKRKTTSESRASDSRRRRITTKQAPEKTGAASKKHAMKVAKKTRKHQGRAGKS